LERVDSLDGFDIQNFKKYLSGGRIFQVIRAAVNIEIFATLGDGFTERSEVGRILLVEEPFLTVLLDTLVSLGLLERNERLYSNSAFSLLHLIPGKPLYLGDMIALEEGLLERFEALKDFARRPRTPEHMVTHETSGFLPLKRSYEQNIPGELYSILKQFNPTFVIELNGLVYFYSRKMVKKAEGARCILTGPPGITPTTDTFFEGAKPEVATSRLAEMNFKNPPDIIMLSHVISGLEEKEIVDLLSDARKILARNGRIMIVDHLLTKDGTSSTESLVYSLELLLSSPKGQVHKRVDLDKWLKFCAYHDISYHSLSGGLISAYGMK
jgi:hypothetical protein